MLNFKGGIRPDSHKYTKNFNITDCLSPEFVKLAVNDSPICVNVGDNVAIGQKITNDNRFHSPICGTVTNTDCGYVTINNNHECAVSNECKPFSKKLSDATFNDIVSFVSQKSIRFDDDYLDTKLKKSLNKVSILLVSCGETVPFSCSRNRILSEHKKEIIYGTQIIMKALSIRKAAITIEALDLKNRFELKKALKNNNNISVVTHSSKYPAEHPKILKDQFLNKYFSNDRDTTADNVLVVGCEEIFELYNSFRTGLPMISRVITVDGDAVLSPKNIKTPIGTDINYLLNFCETNINELSSIVINNPICSSYNKDCEYTKKDISCVLALTKKFEQVGSYNCISCKKCRDVCPVELDPIELLKNQIETTKCICCGACTYACPAKIDFSPIYERTEADYE